MANATKSVLKTYFETGDQPTESNFIDLIDSNINQTDTTDQSLISNLTISGLVSMSNAVTYVSGNFHHTNPGITTRGAGALTGSAYQCKVANVNGETITTLLVDIEGMKSKDDEGDVIGIATVGSSYLMKWETAIHGILYKIEMACLEAPIGGTEDIDLRSDLSSSATYDSNGQNFTLLLTSGGDWAQGVRKGTDGSNGTQTAIANNEYLYLVSGDANTDGVYTAGKYIIKLYGVKEDFS